jgi:hypothetical protein
MKYIIATDLTVGLLGTSAPAAIVITNGDMICCKQGRGM